MISFKKNNSMSPRIERDLRGRKLKHRRLVVRGRSAVYHVMSRMVRRQFWLGDEEREMFAAMLRKQARFAGVEVLTYCVMGNHFHLLVRVPESPLKTAGSHGIDDVVLLRRYREFYGDDYPISAWSADEFQAILTGPDKNRAEAERCRVLARMGNLSEFVRELKHRFTVWFNHRHGNAGTIWSARFKSLLVEDSAEVTTKVAAYIDLNPVRAGLVNDPSEYRWSGYGSAMAGNTDCREGICLIYGRGDGLLRAYVDAIADYRLVLYGKGERGGEGRRIDPEHVRQVVENGGEVTLAEALRIRVRYFTDGVALGSREYLERCFGENRDWFGPKRKRGGSPMRGADWGGLYSTRRLIKKVFG